MAHQTGGAERPAEPIQRLVGPIEKFLHVETASGVVLLAATLIALIVANSPFADPFLAFWKTPFTIGIGSFEMSHSIQHWLNDALMAVFFFVIGLEVKRELAIGELRDSRKAVLPAVAALGGMLVPASVYLALMWGQPAASGWGIPMATDIAFLVGCLAVLGSRIPRGLRVLLLSIAIADDIGAILVIAIGYTDSIQLGALLVAGLGIAAITLLARLGARSFFPYTVLGVVVWVGFHESGIHATIAGVILGLLTPARSYLQETSAGRLVHKLDQLFHGEWESGGGRARQVRRIQWEARETISPLEYLEHTLHPWVSFLVVPLFALANAGVALAPSQLLHPVAGAVAAGLVLGKPLGIALFSWIAVRCGLAQLPEGVSWAALLGGGFLAGIGFTMALFIAGLALEGPLLDAAKLGILAASALAALMGMALLLRLPREAGPRAS